MMLSPGLNCVTNMLENCIHGIGLEGIQVDDLLEPLLFLLRLLSLLFLDTFLPSDLVLLFLNLVLDAREDRIKSREVIQDRWLLGLFHHDGSCCLLIHLHHLL